jgi:hypothetical protein
MSTKKPDRLSAAERDHLKLVAPRFAQAGLKDWQLVARLLEDLELLERGVRSLLPHLPPEIVRLIPAVLQLPNERSPDER